MATKRLPDHLVSKHTGLGFRLSWAREHAQLSVREVAEIAGVAFSAVAEIEKGQRVPRADTLERLAVALNVPACWLVFGDEPAPEGWKMDQDSPSRKTGHRA